MAHKYKLFYLTQHEKLGAKYSYFKRLYCFIIAFGFFGLSVNAQTFYKTPSGKKYHTANCRTVKNVSEAITLDEAVKLGLTPCKICHPQNIYGTITPIKKAHGQSATVQCKGMKKDGTRCLHRTSIANGYCYQHQPK